MVRELVRLGAFEYRSCLNGAAVAASLASRRDRGPVWPFVVGTTDMRVDACFRFVIVAGLCCASGAAADDGFFTEVTQEAGLLDAGPYTPQPDIGSWIWSFAGAAGDFNRDGLPDLFACAGPEGHDKLFINNGDGTFTDEASSWGVDAQHCGMGVAVGDFNNDSWPDVFVSSWGDSYAALVPGKHKLYRNNGDGTFTDIAASAGVQWTSPSKATGFGASWGDYDLDGDLDLAVPGYYGNEDGTKLFRNNGDETFTDVTVDVLGVDMNACYAFLMRFVDMNGDMAPDMYWVGDTKTSHYFQNDGQGAYVDTTAESGLGLDQNGMGADIGDVNHDGLPDMYVSSIYIPNSPIIGNRLYINLGGHAFDEIAEDAGVADGGWGWGILVQDLDNDGDDDLADTSGRSQNSPDQQRDALRVWLNDGDGMSYTEVPAVPALDDHWGGRGLNWIDYDLDGDLDVIVFSGQDHPHLFRNDTPVGPETGWLHVTLDTEGKAGLAPDGVGARIVFRTGEVLRYRWMAASSNFVSQNETAVHVGLGSATVVDELTVEWPNGEVTVLEDVAANQRITVHPPACVADVNGDGVLNILDFVAFQGLFQAGDAAADLNGDGVLNILDFVAMQTLFAAGCGS